MTNLTRFSLFLGRCIACAETRCATPPLCPKLSTVLLWPPACAVVMFVYSAVCVGGISFVTRPCAVCALSSLSKSDQPWWFLCAPSLRPYRTLVNHINSWRSSTRSSCRFLSDNRVPIPQSRCALTRPGYHWCFCSPFFHLRITCDYPLYRDKHATPTLSLLTAIIARLTKGSKLWYFKEK